METEIQKVLGDLKKIQLFNELYCSYLGLGQFVIMRPVSQYLETNNKTGAMLHGNAAMAPSVP